MSSRIVSRVIFLLLFVAIAFVSKSSFYSPYTTRTHTQSAAVAEVPIATDIPYGFYAVAKVVDGDTVDVLKDGKTERVRLIGINTPEVVDPRKPVQCFGKEASAHMHELLDGNVVRLEPDNTQDIHDKYGRTLAYIFLEDGTNINELQIQGGYAYEYTYNHAHPYRFQKEFKAAETSARTESRGLWATNTCDGKK